MNPGIINRYGSWAKPKTDENGDPLDVPKTPKWEAGYMLPPQGVAFCCETCVHFREPDECAIVGNKGAVIHPEGCCNRWQSEGALPSTPDDANPGEDLLDEHEEEPDEREAEMAESWGGEADGW